MGVLTDSIFQAGQVTRFFYDDSVITDFKNTFVLRGYAGNSHSSTLRKLGSNSGYPAPTGGYTIIGVQLSLDSGTLTTTENAWAVYVDNDIGLDSASYPTNYKVLGTFGDPGVTAGGRYYQRVHWYIPATKYFTLGNFFVSGGNGFFQVFCRLGRV